VVRPRQSGADPAYPRSGPMLSRHHEAGDFLRYLCYQLSSGGPVASSSSSAMVGQASTARFA
jgi:hypothetical protein